MKPKTKSVPIRMDSATLNRLDTAAKHLANSRAGIIRMAILQVLDEIEARQSKTKKLK
jgi:predicted DNA-binding protein